MCVVTADEIGAPRMLPTEGQFDNEATPSPNPPHPLPPRTLVAVEISHAVLARDVLPVGAARQRDGLGERLPGVDLEETRRRLYKRLSLPARRRARRSSSSSRGRPLRSSTFSWL